MAKKYIMSPQEEADMEALSYYLELEEYIEEHNGRFFFGRNKKSGLNFFKELSRLLPNLKKVHRAVTFTIAQELLNVEQAVMALMKAHSKLILNEN